MADGPALWRPDDIAPSSENAATEKSSDEFSGSENSVFKPELMELIESAAENLRMSYVVNIYPLDKLAILFCAFFRETAGIREDWLQTGSLVLMIFYGKILVLAFTGEQYGSRDAALCISRNGCFMRLAVRSCSGLNDRPELSRFEWAYLQALASQ